MLTMCLKLSSIMLVNLYDTLNVYFYLFPLSLLISIHIPQHTPILSFLPAEALKLTKAKGGQSHDGQTAETECKARQSDSRASVIEPSTNMLPKVPESCL